MSRWPNFFLIGAAKSGTTSLYYYLKQHPQIFMSAVKEPKYFALPGQPLDYTGPGDARIRPQTTTTEDAYLALFSEAADQRILGEASTLYLSDIAGTARRVADRVPGARIAAILRHPADRAFSAWLHLRRDGFETLDSFQQALAAEPERIRQHYYYHWRLRNRGFYGRDLQDWYDAFPREQIRIYLYEDLNADPLGLMADLFRFLGVDDSFQPDVSARHNQSGLPRNQQIQDFLTKQHPAKEWLKRIVPERLGHRIISKVQPGLIVTPRMTGEMRAQLSADFREDILRLQDLIRRDLSHWLADAVPAD